MVTRSSFCLYIDVYFPSVRAFHHMARKHFIAFHLPIYWNRASYIPEVDSQAQSLDEKIDEYTLQSNEENCSFLIFEISSFSFVFISILRNGCHLFSSFVPFSATHYAEVGRHISEIVVFQRSTQAVLMTVAANFSHNRHRTEKKFVNKTSLISIFLRLVRTLNHQLKKLCRIVWFLFTTILVSAVRSIEAAVYYIYFVVLLRRINCCSLFFLLVGLFFAARAQKTNQNKKRHTHSQRE